MTLPDEQLVARITELVADALRRQQAGGGPVSDPPVSRAVTGYGGTAYVQPPAGLCTAGSAGHSVPPAEDSIAAAPTIGSSPAAPAGHPTSVVSAAVLTGIVTARQLEDAFAAAGGQPVQLAENARPTPLALDWLKEHPGQVQRVAAPATALSGRVSDALPWLWWAEGHCNFVQQVTSRFSRQLHPSSAARSEAGLIEVIASLQAGVAARRLAGGLLFVQQAPLATGLASRQPALRAATATAPATLEAAMTQWGANVLVLEYPRLSLERMTPLVERFIARVPVVPAHLRRVLGQG